MVINGACVTPDTILYRRRSKPSLEEVDETVSISVEDAEFIQKEADLGFGGLIQMLSSQGFWVNPYAAAERAEHKPLQLLFAREVGLQIPRTLIGNDPEAIKGFLGRSGDAGYIYKPFHTAFWKDANGQQGQLPTSDISLAHLPDAAALRLTPGIFQEKIAKAFEVRVTVFGAGYVAVGINSQSKREGQTDWRVVPVDELDISPVSLPPSVWKKCLALMEQLGVVFGCFDFIVTPEGEYVFLEINGMGQFLWLERVCPELPVLDMMCRFLMSGDPEFEYTHHKTPLLYKDYL